MKKHSCTPFNIIYKKNHKNAKIYEFSHDESGSKSVFLCIHYLNTMFLVYFWMHDIAFKRLVKPIHFPYIYAHINTRRMNKENPHIGDSSYMLVFITFFILPRKRNSEV